MSEESCCASIDFHKHSIHQHSVWFCWKSKESLSLPFSPFLSLAELKKRRHWRRNDGRGFCFRFLSRVGCYLWLNQLNPKLELSSRIIGRRIYPRGCFSSSLRTVKSQNSKTKWSFFLRRNTSIKFTRFGCFSCYDWIGQLVFNQQLMNCNWNRIRRIVTEMLKTMTWTHCKRKDCIRFEWCSHFESFEVVLLTSWLNWMIS